MSLAITLLLGLTFSQGTVFLVTRTDLAESLCSSVSIDFIACIGTAVVWLLTNQRFQNMFYISLPISLCIIKSRMNIDSTPHRSKLMPHRCLFKGPYYMKTRCPSLDGVHSLSQTGSWKAILLPWTFSFACQIFLYSLSLYLKSVTFFCGKRKLSCDIVLLNDSVSFRESVVSYCSCTKTSTCMQQATCILSISY